MTQATSKTMPCPACQSIVGLVIDKRNRPNYVRRRRKCLDCGHRYSTVEVSVKRMGRSPREGWVFIGETK